LDQWIQIFLPKNGKVDQVDPTLGSFGVPNLELDSSREEECIQEGIARLEQLHQEVFAASSNSSQEAKTESHTPKTETGVPKTNSSQKRKRDHSKDHSEDLYDEPVITVLPRPKHDKYKGLLLEFPMSFKMAVPMSSAVQSTTPAVSSAIQPTTPAVSSVTQPNIDQPEYQEVDLLTGPVLLPKDPKKLVIPTIIWRK
jgi:hypothetical protein